MDKFFNTVLLIMSWLFLAVGVIMIIFLLTLNNGEMSEMWPMLIGSALASIFFAALAWVARKTSLYIDSKQSENDLEE
jgi:hypothetical protein